LPVFFTPSALSDPTLISGSLTARGFSVRWTGGLNNTLYQYSFNGGTTRTGITVTPDGSGNTTTFTNLSSGTYNVTIIAVNNEGSTLSNSIPILLLPSDVTGLTHSAITDNGFTLDWVGGTGATSYIYRLTDLSGNLVMQTDSSGNLEKTALAGASSGITDNGIASRAAIFTGLISSSYSVRVTPNNASGNGLAATRSPILLIPSALTNLQQVAGSTTNSQVTITWSGGLNANVNNYSYDFVGNTTSGSSAVYNGSPTNTAVFSGLTYAASFTIRLRAGNSTGNTLFSEIIVYLAPSAITGLAVVPLSTTNSQFSIAWSGGLNYDSYEYNRINIIVFIMIHMNIIIRISSYSL
jgi:hypothetical protein